MLNVCLIKAHVKMIHTSEAPEARKSFYLILFKLHFLSWEF